MLCSSLQSLFFPGHYTLKHKFQVMNLRGSWQLPAHIGLSMSPASAITAIITNKPPQLSSRALLQTTCLLCAGGDHHRLCVCHRDVHIWIIISHDLWNESSGWIIMQLTATEKKKKRNITNDCMVSFLVMGKHD